MVTQQVCVDGIFSMEDLGVFFYKILIILVYEDINSQSPDEDIKWKKKLTHQRLYGWEAMFATLAQGSMKLRSYH